MFFRFPRYGKYATAANFEWDRYDFIYGLLETKSLEKSGDEMLSKAAFVLNDCYIKTFDIDCVKRAIDKLNALIRFDDDHGPGTELDEEVKKIYGENRAYKYSQDDCKALINDLNRLKLVMEDPCKDDGTPADVYWMIYAY